MPLIIAALLCTTGLFLGMLVLVDLGRRIGVRRLTKDPEGAMVGVGAVEAAENWGTYVTVHVYTSRAIRIALAGGVKGIDHRQLIDEPTAKLLAEKGVWLSLQPFLR